jgi:hypothetical protein
VSRGSKSEERFAIGAGKGILRILAARVRAAVGIDEQQDLPPRMTN